MWTTKEVVIISIATGLAFCFATIYSQRKVQQYIDNKVIEKSINPLSSLMNNDMTFLGKNNTMPIVESQPTVQQESPAQENKNNVPIKKQIYHDTPPGAGERWTPLAIA